jgi:hypothetical protein
VRRGGLHEVAVNALAYPLEVLSVLRSPRGWAIVPVHYSHDPARGSGWADKAREGYRSDADWAREQELDFTRAAATPAYPAFVRPLHVTDAATYDPARPVWLALDFNVAPCVWEVCQPGRMDGRPVLLVVAEVVADPASHAVMCEEVRRRFEGHKGVLRIYGDATGRARDVQSGQTDFDLILRQLSRWWQGAIELKVPNANPAESQRVSGLNDRLLDQDGLPGVLVNPACVELIADLEQVELDGGGKLRKSHTAGDPYARRTHSSDALGYLVWWEWPVRPPSAGAPAGKTERRRSYGSLLGGMR